MPPRGRSDPKTRQHDARVYRSGLEERIGGVLDEAGITYRFEDSADKVAYTVPAKSSKYLPDFVIEFEDRPSIIIETKGIWTYDDRYKHLLLRQQRPDLDIRFVFSRANQRISKRSRTTYRDICEGRGRGAFKGVTWKYSDKVIPKEWLDEMSQLSE